MIGAGFSVMTPRGDGREGLWGPRRLTFSRARNEEVIIPVKDGEVKEKKFSDYLDAVANQVTRWYRKHRRAFYVTIAMLELVYIFGTVPLRVAFFFDPYAAKRGATHWTKSLTIYSTFDVLCEVASVVSLFEMFAAQRRALAAIAADAANGQIRPRMRGRRGQNPNQSGKETKTSLVAWSLNTIVPTVKQKFDIRQPLIYEAIAMIPFEALALGFGVNSLHLFRSHKLFRLHRVADCLMEIKRLHARNSYVQLLDFTGNALLVKRVLIGLLLCHLIACTYMAIAHWQCGLDFQLCERGVDANYHSPGDPIRYTCWAIEDQLVGATPLRKYARAMYWASRSVITLGYYDVAPITDVETAFAIMVQVVGAIFSTSLIATFLFVFRHLNSRKQDFMTHVDEAKEYMKMSKIPEDIRDAVLTFYRNAWEAHGGLSQSEVSEKLPGHLRVRVTSVLITQRVQQVAFLAKESIEFINTLALKMDTCVYSPKDWIIEKIPDGMFFIIRGNVMIESLSQSQPRYAKAGDHFAEFAILYPGRADDRVRAQTYCELYKLAQRWFHETMELFHRHEAPAQLERMRSMLNRRDQQQQKMKRMLGRSMGELGGDSDRALSLTGQSLGSRYQLSWNMPGSTFRRWWELLRIIFLTFVSYEVPFFIVFDTAVFPFKKTPKYNIQSLTSLAGEIFFTFDFVLRCRFFAFIDPLARIPVNDASYIFEWYKGNGLWWDLFSVIPVSTVLEFTYGPQWMIGPVFRLVRMLRLRHFPAMIQDLAQTRGLSSKVQLAMTLFLSVTLSLHIMGCLWFLMARLSMEEDHFDVRTANLTRTGCLRDATRFGNCSWAVFDAYGQIGDGFPIATISTDGSVYTSKLAYLRSIYWAVVALTTVGYGDIVAFSTHESLFAALWAFIGGVINYAVVAAMSNIISNLTATSHHHMEKMNQVNLAMAHYRISEKLRTQIRRFYHQQFYMQKVASEAKLLMRLPQQLRHRISLILHAESVRKVSLFADHGNERLLHDITGQFRRAVFQRGDYISHENTICDEAFVIISGRANMFRKKMMSVPVGALHQGVTYGVAEMLLQVNWPATSIAATVVEVSVITHQAFAMMIERRFPNDTAELKEKAAVDYDAELGLLDAVAGNFRLYDKLHRYSDRCTSMFVSQDNSASQSAKERVRFYWDILVVLLMMYNAFVISFRIPFLKHPTEQVRRMLIGLDLWCDALMSADIMLKLYYFECDAGLWNLVARQEKNANYAQHYLKQDLWSLLPLYYIGDNFFVMSLCRLPRLVRLRQLSSSIDSLIVRIQERFASVGNISAYLGPVKLMMVLIFAAHFADCIFYWISTMDHNPNSWIHHDHVVHQEHGSVSVLYLRSFYWSLTTLTLVGSRELVPLDTPSTLFAGLTCLCCTFVVGHIIGELSDLTLELDKAKKELQERESSFEEFAKDHDLPTSIRNRVAEYLSFQHMYSKGIDLGAIFDDLSPNLRVQLMMDLHGDVLRNLPITQYLSDSQLRALALHLKSELYIPGDNVIVEGDPGHKLYVLKRGSATVLWKSTGTAVATLAVGSLFGEVAFFLKGTKRIASVQMAVASEVLVIDRRSWDRLMLSSGVAERNKTETSMVQWVRDCLKGYNVMTVEVVNDLKCVVSQVEANAMNIDVVCIADFLLKYSAFRRIRREHSDEAEEVPLGLLPKLDGHFLFEVFVTFPLDFLLFFPHFESYTHAKWYYLSLFQLNKIFRIYEAKEASERLAQFLAYDLNLPIRDSTLRFLRSTTTYLLAGHWIACIWYRTSLLAFETYDVSWFVMPKMLAVDQFTSLPDISLMRAYLRSAHFAAGSITTVFYGDIASCNVLETVVEIGVIICSIFVFGMLAGAHTEHLVAKYKHRMKFEQDLVELYYYLKSNEVPREIRKRLKLYYLNTWLRYHGHDDFEGVHGLSTLLVEDIAQYTLRGFSASVSIFKSCDECFLRALLTCLKHIICSPSEQIVRKGDVDRSMYFISHGKVLVEGTGFQLVKEEGDFFGELSLLYGIPRSATCSSLGTSLLYVLEWEAYERILLDYPEYRRVNRREWVITVMIGFGASVLSPREDNATLQQPPSPSPPASRKEGVSFQPQLGHVDVFTHRISRWYRRRKYALRLAMVAVDVTYIFVTVPLRIAFFFDPYADPVTRKQWTKALVIYSAFDALSDIASILSLSRIYRTQQHAVAAVVMDPENVNIRVRQRPQGDKSSFLSRVRKTSSMIVWSLNTIVPTMKHQFDIKRPLVYEAIAMAPLDLLAIWFGVNSLHVLRAHKLFRLHRVSDCVTEIKKLYARSKLVRALEFPGNSLLLNRIALGLVLCHLIACIYMGLAHWQCGLDFQLCTRGIALSTTQQSGTTEPLRYTCWAIEDQLVGATPLRKYARSIYFASRSMLNVGYYDTTPATDLETLYAIVVQVISAIFSTSMIATFIFLFRYLNYRKQAFMAHVDEAKEYMKISKVPEDVRDAVLNFYNSVWEASGGLSPGDIMQSLPGHLRVRVTSVLITQRIQQVAFLAKESVEFLNTLTLKMEPNVFSAKDWIIEKVPDGMYFVLYGSVTIELVGQSQPRYAKAGEHFAEFALLFPGRTDERARAQTYCQLYKLSRRWFHETMELFHRDKASGQIELMQAMLNRRDQQQQKMKKMLGRSVDEFGGASSRTITSSGLNLGRRSRIPWNLPGSAFRKWWELLRLLFLTFVSYEVPFFIVFDTAEFPFTKTPTYNIQSVTSLVVEVFFTVDFVLRCRFFAFIDPLARIPVTDATYIFDWYKTKGLWWDLISIIPVSTILEFSYGSKWMIGPVFRLVRMLRLRHFPSVIQDLVQTRGLSSKVQLAIALILLVTLSFHITGCLWFLMARMSIDEDHFEIPSASLSRTSCLRDVTLYGNCSWAVFDAYGQIREGFPSLPIGRLDTIYSGKLAYIRSVYWAIVALTTVGYGDIVAFSTHETLFSALWSFIGGVINYAVVSGMSDLASNWTAARRGHMEKTNDANITFARYRVSEDVRTQIRRHYHQQFYMQKVTSEAKLLMHLPQQLRHRISLILHAEAVKKIPLFVDYGNERLLHDITGQFRRAVFQRGDSLVHENAICDEAFVIISGRANMFCKRTGAIPTGALHTGACHGVAAMVLHLNSPATVVAATVVEVSSITHQDFSATMDHHFPNDITSLKARANDQYVVETSSVSAIVQNLLDRKKLRHSKRCTTMFVSSGSTNDQARKEQLRFYWDIAIMCVIAFHGLEVPFRIPFMHRPLKSTWVRLMVVDLVSDLLLWLDILLKMYYFDCDAGLRNLITREKKNASYAEYNLKQDLWSQLPLYYVGDNYLVMNLCRMPRLIRLTQLSSLIDSLIIRLQQRFSPYGNISAYLRPFKLMLFLIFVSHLCGCVFYLVSDMDTNPNSWLLHDVVLTQENFSPFALYLRSFYWALTTFTLVGTKDIAPLDTIGTIFACFTCLCCTFIVGVILGELSELVLDMDKAKKLLHERESRFEEFAKDHDLPTSLRLRANRYLKFQHSHQKGMNIYEMFEDLPQNLRVQLMMDLHGNLLRHLPISKYLSETQINRLAIRLRSELYIASDTVLVEGDPGLKLCILKKGSAQVWHRLWECIIVLIAVFYATSLPLLISFSSRTETPPGDERVNRWEIYVLTIDVLCIIDFLLKYSVFRYIKKATGEEEEVKTRGVVSKRFVFDLITALPLELLLRHPAFASLCKRKWYYLSILQCNKIPRIFEGQEASGRLAQVFAYDLKLPVRDSTLRFIRSIGTFVLSGHWIACLWYFASVPSYEHYGVSWFTTPKMLALDHFTSLADVSYWRRYLRSAHFSAGSISTVFYGDIGSANLVETIFELLINLIAIFVFGVLTGAHSEHLEATYKHRMRFEQDLVELYHYLKDNDVPREIRKRLKLYYLNTWLRYRGHDDFEGVQGLSTLLVEDIAQYTLRGFSSSVSIFQSCDECFLRALLTCLKHIVCSPSEQIVRKGDVDRSMYFISHGKVLVEGTGFQLVKEEGDFFGELSLLYGIPRSATCSSLGLSLLYVLEWEAYERILLDYPEYRRVNRREWVIVSTKLRAGDLRFRSIIDIVSRMENADWLQVDEIIRKAKNLK
ncbi:hypothetical protein Poli38472_011913 [Pythium oligandrum]|uniref:Cyclic nucleotide-binding domain-containing protein n=1 Tax=Pythium oligandrum TaxID=41045 RepID=A0A8K1C8P2_PYTOL|nr:hypothetical protein Poli38472_011913 [Pythium oligandrum]|eukprot:TMW58325.1 hypothetical protein Poli38472_011913 [Pythium oligandrum]